MVPRRIHKDKPVAKKLGNLDPKSILGAWDWELRGDYYYPVVTEAPMDPALVEAWRRRNMIVSKPTNRWGSLIKLSFMLIPIVAGLVAWLLS